MAKRSSESRHDTLKVVLDCRDEVLEVGTTVIDAQGRFEHAGLTSQLATSLITRLEAKLLRRLPLTVVWDYPTPASLARYLVGESPK